MKKIGKLIIEWVGDSERDDEFAWDDFLVNLDEELKKKNKDIYWYVEVENFGWMKRSGHKYFTAKDAREWLSAILPDADCHFKIYNYGKGLAIQNYHHDSPTGNEWYYVKPITESTYGKNS